MKVKCISEIVENSIKDYDIKIGNEYIVLSIEIDFDEPLDAKECRIFDCVTYRIIDSYGIMMPYPSKLFEIIDPSIPPNWLFKKLSDSFVIIRPIEWDYNGFLEEYYDGESRAVKLVKNQIQMQL